MEAIDHLDLVVGDFDRSLAFYTDLLRPLGYVRHGEIAGERGEKVVYINRVGGYGAVSIRQAQSDAHPVPYDRYAIGIHHICFSAPNRAAVDDRARWLGSGGHTIESGPKEYGYTPGYYAVFFYDPDGIKLEILHRPREGDLVGHGPRAQNAVHLEAEVEVERRRGVLLDGEDRHQPSARASADRSRANASRSAARPSPRWRRIADGWIVW